VHTLPRLSLQRSDCVVARKVPYGPGRHSSVVRYWFPAIDHRFRSGMHDLRNFELSSGGADAEVVERVIARERPLAHATLATRGEAAALARAAIEADCSVRFTRVDGASRLPGAEPEVAYTLELCPASPDRLGALLDVDALVEDYRAWFEDAPAWIADDIATTLSDAAEEPTSTFLERALVDPEAAYRAQVLLSEPEEWADRPPATPGAYAHEGLLFGHPPAITAARIGFWHGVEGFDLEYLQLPAVFGA